ncbi:MAG TPA: TadE family protein [Vicinamibacterales bacterium]
MAALNPKPRWSSERGAELIEMVIALPLLLLLMFGIVDFGFMFQRYVVLTNAAMEGARVGILPGYGINDAKLRAEAYATTGGIPAGEAIADPQMVTLDEPGGGTWPAIEVTVRHPYTYQFAGPFASMFGGSLGTVTLTARSTMRRQLGS